MIKDQWDRPRVEQKQFVGKEKEQKTQECLMKKPQSFQNRVQVYLRIFKKLNQQTRRLVYYKLQNISERIFFKYTNKWKGISSSQIEGIDVKILIIPKSIYKHNTIPIKMPWYFLHK